MKSLLHHSMGTISFIKYRFSLYGSVQEGCGVVLVCFFFLLGYVLDFQEGVIFSQGSFLSCFGGHLICY